MVASTDALASQVGVDVLRAGGNAADAAVAVALALAVVNPEAGNLGGGGFALARTPGGELHALDFRSTAPAGATRDMFRAQPPEGHGPLSEEGVMSVAVPGSPRGLAELHARLGRRPWAEVVEPAVALARGFPVRPRLTRSYPPHVVAALRRHPAAAAVFLPGGEPPREGDTFRQEDLAGTLARLRDHGADGFYRGETADLLVAEMERGGGRVTRADLDSYRALWRRPLEIPYRGRLLVSMPLSSSGGIALAATARMLSERDVGALPWHGAEHVHLLAEAWRRAFADRNHYLADPAFADPPVEELTSEAYARWRMGSVGSRATPSGEVRPGVEAWRGGDHTTHLSVVDGRGGAVALTTTLNTWYGSKVVAEGTGVLLNNEMDDLSTRPGEPNHFGLVQGEINAVEAGKRPLSAMTPSLLLDGDGALRMALGNAGGATIITTVWQLVSSVVDHGLEPAAALAAPRVHHQHLPDRIQVEPGGLGEEVVADLRARGHDVEERGEMSGDAHLVAVEPDGTLVGASDPRRGGEARGV